MKQRFLLLFLPLCLGSCSRWIAPPYTSVDKMLNLEKGMNPNQVNETLGIKPYNILHRNDSTAVLEFYYRLKDRDLNNITNYNDFIHQERSQVGGKNWYTKPSKFYLLYEHDRLSTLITENGLENSDYLLLKNNNLMLVSQSDLVDFKLWEDATYLHRIDDTQKMKAKKNIRHSILYAAKIPYGAIGLKYVVGGKIGGYVSGALSPDWGIFTFITGGPVLRASSVFNIYLGAGVGPYYYEDDDYGYEEELYMDSFVIEAGTLLYLKMISLDLGAGVNFDQGLYVNFGLGINF
jgi:hypothetical protein